MYLWIIATVVAFFVKGVCGFANALVFSSILSFGTDNVNISPVGLLLDYPANIIMAVKERKHIQWKLCLPIAGIVLVGSIPGIFFLKNINAAYVKKGFGIVIAMIAIIMLIRELTGKKGKKSKVLLFVIGLASGILSGLYGIGILLATYMKSVTEDTHVFKANLCVVFLIENTCRIISYSIMGIITLQVLKRAAILWPIEIAAIALGMICSRFMNEKIIRLIVIAMLIVSGIALVLM